MQLFDQTALAGGSFSLYATESARIHIVHKPEEGFIGLFLVIYIHIVHIKTKQQRSYLEGKSILLIYHAGADIILVYKLFRGNKSFVEQYAAFIGIMHRRGFKIGRHCIDNLFSTLPISHFNIGDELPVYQAVALPWLSLLHSALEVINSIFISAAEIVCYCAIVPERIDTYIYSGYGDDYFWFGTDYLGRDLWTRVWRGCRISLIIAFAAVLTNVGFGVIYGSIAGYYGGMTDMVMMRFAEIVQAFPNIVVMTLFIMYFGNGLFAIIMALVVRDWVGTATLIRAQFYRFKDSEYVLAARTLGTKDAVLIFRHILPNAIGPIVTRTMIAIPSAIFAESFLAYIGLGIRAPEASLGVLLSHAQTVLLQYPYQTVFPAVLISVLMISFNLFGNGLRDAFDPTQRGT